MVCDTALVDRKFIDYGQMLEFCYPKTVVRVTILLVFVERKLAMPHDDSCQAGS